MTICVVALLNGKTKEEWYAWIKDRVEKKIGWDTPEEIAPVFATQGGTGQGADGPAYGAGAGGGMRIGGLGGLGGGSVLSALAGGLQQQVGGAGGAHDEQQPQGIRLPQALAGALSGAGIVFRPGSQLSEHGEQLYEAHLVNEDESGSEGDENEQSDDGRPALTHQPEIVDSPRASSETGSAGGEAKVAVQPSSEGGSSGMDVDKKTSDSA